MQKKFRGISIEDGEYIYGYYYKDGEDEYIFDEETDDWVEVKPSSVKQLVGYDIDGVELYEDDIVIGSNEMDYKVGLKMDYELYSGSDKFISQFKKKIID